MKLKVSHLFFLLLAVLLLSNLGLSIKEGLENLGDLDGLGRGKNNDYILKSQIVTPVCPKCPDVNVCSQCKGELPQPCPPCGRCPKPAFKCAKVPDYSSSQVDDSLPRPMLSDFSQFAKPNSM